jgi:signal transduction histidine kinase
MQSLNFKLGEGVAGIVLATGRTINVADVRTDPRYVMARSDDEPDNTSVRSLLVAPVKTEEKLLGTLSVQSPTAGAFTDHDERLLTTLGVQAAAAIEKARLYADLQAALAHEKATRAQLVQSEKLAALGRIVASVAHELNNPLQAIQNALYLIKLEQNLTPQAREDLQTVLNEADRMADLIARLRETYRPAHSEEFHLASINEIVDEVRRLIGTHLRRNQITYEAQYTPNLPYVPVIRDQIKQVLLNICLNAVEAMPDGGKIVVHTDMAPQADLVLVNIANTGPLIDPGVLPYIFDPFITTKEGGTGLGLAISYDILQRHGGRISAGSMPGVGPRFEIALPIVPAIVGSDLEDDAQ